MSMQNSKQKLTEYLKNVAEWRWSEFVRAERSKDTTIHESIVLGLIRACVSDSLPAIKSAMNRIDGKAETPVRIIMPKVWHVYMNAHNAPAVLQARAEKDQGAPRGLEITEKSNVFMNEREYGIAEDVPTVGLRETMARMIIAPRGTAFSIIEAQALVDEWLAGKREKPQKDPRVKSVVVAHILKMAQDRSLDAMDEVFVQMDGRLAETIRVIGDDMYILNFGSDAPPGGFINSDGYYQVEAPREQELWRSKLSPETTKAIVIEEGRRDDTTKD